MAETVIAIGAFVTNAILGPGTLLEATSIGTAVAINEAIGTLLVLGTSAAIQSALATTPSLSIASQKANYRQPTAPRRRCYGRVKVGGPIAFLTVKDAPNLNKPGTDGQLFSLILLAAHEIDGIEQYWLSDALVTLDGSGLVNEAPFFQEGWRRAKLMAQLGTDSQAAQPDLLAIFPEWTAAHRLRGIANLLGRFGSLEDKAFTKVFPNGVPVMTVLMRSSKVWDPRITGEDADDKSTWVFTLNGPQIVMNYIWADDGMRLPRELVELALDDWVDKINAAEAQVTLAVGGTEDRFRLSGAYDLTSPSRDVLPLMLDPMGADLRMRGDGAIILDLPDYYEPTVILTDDHIISYADLRHSPQSGDLRNEIRAKYLSPENGYVEQEAEPWQDAASIAVNGIQSTTLDLTWCPSHAQARRRMKLEAYRLNPEWTATLSTNAYGLNTIGERLIRVQIGELELDIVCERTSFKFEPASGRCAIGIRSIDPAAFQWDGMTEEGSSPGSGTPAANPPPDAPYGLVAVLESSGSTMHFNLSYDTVDTIAGFYAQWSPYIPGQADDDIVWQDIVTNQFPDPPFIQADVPGNGVTPIQVRAWFQTSGGIKSGYAYDIISTETSGAPGPVTGFTAGGGEDLIGIQFTAPTSPNFSYVRLWKSATGAPFGSAFEYTSNFYAAPGELKDIEFTSTDYGTFRLWAVAYSGTGVASTEVGPQSVTVTSP